MTTTTTAPLTVIVGTAFVMLPTFVFAVVYALVHHHRARHERRIALVLAYAQPPLTMPVDFGSGAIGALGLALAIDCTPAERAALDMLGRDDMECRCGWTFIDAAEAARGCPACALGITMHDTGAAR